MTTKITELAIGTFAIEPLNSPGTNNVGSWEALEGWWDPYSGGGDEPDS